MGSRGPQDEALGPGLSTDSKRWLTAHQRALFELIYHEAGLNPEQTCFERLLGAMKTLGVTLGVEPHTW